MFTLAVTHPFLSKAKKVKYKKRWTSVQKSSFIVEWVGHLNGDRVLGLGFLFWLGFFLFKSSTYFSSHLFLKMFKYERFHVNFQFVWEKECVIWGHRPQASTYWSWQAGKTIQFHLLARESVLRDPENIICLPFLQVTARYHDLALRVYFCHTSANRPLKTGTVSKRKHWS